MTSPFNGKREAVGGKSYWADMIPGETRTTPIGKDGETITLTRTRRPFVYDFADAQNRRLNPRGFHVSVVAGALHFGKYRKPDPDRPLTQEAVDAMADGPLSSVLIAIGLDKGWIIRDERGRYRPAEGRR